MIDNITQRQYDTIVGNTLVNLYTLSKDKESVNFGDFDINDEEHLYLLSVAICGLSILDKPIRFNLPIWKRKKIYKMFSNEKVEWKKGAKTKDCFDTSEVIDYIRLGAAEITCDEIFTLDEIYREYYERKANEQ